MATLKPLGDRVLVRPDKKDAVSKGGIALPPNASKEKPQQGTVVAVGPGKTTDDGKTVPMPIKAGSKVLFTKYGPTEVKVNDEELLILDERDILGVFED